MSKFIFLKTNLTTNFKPELISDFKNYNIFKKNKVQICCKNFFLYLLLLKYKNKNFYKSNIFIKKHKKKTYTILRSPYRHKLARHQIVVNRYEINSSIFIKLNCDIKTNKWDKITYFFNIINKFNNLFESNLIFVNSFNFSFPIIFSINFKINNK